MRSFKKISIKDSVKVMFANRNFLILIIATIGMLPVLASVGGFYIYGDITTQMLPFVYEMKRMFASGVPFWSWNTYFGDNFIASYAYYTVFNPFTWINCLFPYKYLGQVFTIVLYLKFLVCGYIAQKYLKKIGFNDKLSLIGSLLYTFSSWAISNLYYYMFMEPMILLPFLLIFMERFLRREKHAYSGLALATFVTIAVNYYFASVNLISAALYFFCRLSYLKKKSCQETEFSDNKDYQNLGILTLKAAGCFGLGVVCASVILIPVLSQLKGSPQVSFNFLYSDPSILADRVFWMLYPKTHEGKFYYIFLNWGCMSNAASIAVFGLLPSLLLFIKKGNSWIKLLTVLLVIIYFTPLNGLFSLFTDIYYSRWTYTLTLVLIICTLYYLRDSGLPRFKYSVWYCITVYGAFFLFAGASIYWQLHNGGNFSFARAIRLGMDALVVALNAIALLLLCSNNTNMSMRFTASIMAVSVCVSVQFLVFSLSSTEFLRSEQSVMTEAEYFIRGGKYMENEDFHFRTNFKVLEPTGWTSCNFGLICNRPSIETYHSVQNNKIQKWKNIVSDTIHPKRVFYPKNYVRSFEALMSVKDIIMVSDDNDKSLCFGSPTHRDELFDVYESDHYIPIGFAYDSYILSDSIEYAAKNDSSLDIPMVLLSALAIDREDEADLSLYLKKGRIDRDLSLDSLVVTRRAVTCDHFKGNTKGFYAHIESDSTSVVFFSVLADEGFTAYVDGNPTKIYETNLGFSSVIVPAGSHEINFRYFPPGLKLGIILSAIGWLITAILFFKHH